MKIKTAETSGQALVESILVIPIFFIFLSGILFFFQIQSRLLSDAHAVNAQLLSNSYLVAEEKWTHEDPNELIAKQAYYSFMPSAFFFNSIDMVDHLFADKIPLQNLATTTCQKHRPAYQVFRQEEGAFQLATCADEFGYEREKKVPFSFAITDPRKVYVEQNLYYPQAGLSPKFRKSLITKAYAEFSATGESILFQQQQASILLSYAGEWNRNCFMRPFSPNCSVQRVESILSRTAIDSAKIQLTFCVSEAVATCLGTGPAVAACTAGKMAQLKNALELGTEAWICPIVNTTVRSLETATQIFISGQQSALLGQEARLRSEILTQ